MGDKLRYYEERIAKRVEKKIRSENIIGSLIFAVAMFIIWIFTAIRFG